MSTEYAVIEKGGFELNVYEHSTLLDICIRRGQLSTSIKDLTAEELAAIGVEFIRVAEYQNPEVYAVSAHDFTQIQLVNRWARKTLFKE